MAKILKLKQSERKHYLLIDNAPFISAIKKINKNKYKFLIVINKHKKVIGTLTDGDIRRANLKFKNFEKLKLKDVISNKFIKVNYKEPDYKIENYLTKNKIPYIPIVNNLDVIKGIAVLGSNRFKTHNNTIIIMAGGKGKRMMPLTKDKPKPLISYKGMSILKNIIINAKKQGFINFIISINYLGDMIKNEFGNGSKLGINIEYIFEKNPLGTAGSLSLIKKSFSEPVIVTNADIITNVDYSLLLDFHIKKKSFTTVVLKNYSWQNPYGVVKIKNLKVKDIIEKPVYMYSVLAGIYVLDKKFNINLKTNIKLDMPNYLQYLINLNKKIIGYSLYEDILEISNYNEFLKLNKL
jgi:choline kinase